MTVTTNSKTDLVSGQVAAVQAQASGFVDFSVGSILLAVVEAVSDVALWLQGLILFLLATTRAATSKGPDLDSWMADFGFVRLVAVASTGMETFNRNTATTTGLVPIGSTVQTTDGTQTFTVTVDTTNSAYNAGLGGYTLAPTVFSVTVPVRANTPGSAGNALAGTVTVITSSIPGIDTCTNGSQMAGGADAEADGAYRTRFQLYISSLSKATLAAIGFALSQLGAAVTWSFAENVNYAGSAKPGNLVVVVNDGTGSPPSGFLTAAGLAVDAVRAAGMTFEIHGPVGVTANIAMTITAAPGYDPTATAATVQAAILAYIAKLTLGQTLYYNRLIQLAFDASPGVLTVTATTINSGASDLTATVQQVIVAGTATVGHT